MSDLDRMSDVHPPHRVTVPERVQPDPALRETRVGLFGTTAAILAMGFVIGLVLF